MTEPKSGGYFGTAAAAMKNVLYNVGMLAGNAYLAKQAIGPQITRQAFRSALRTGPGAVAIGVAAITASQLIDSVGNPEFVSAMGSMGENLPSLRTAGQQGAKFHEFVMTP